MKCAFPNALNVKVYYNYIYIIYYNVIVTDVLRKTMEIRENASRGVGGQTNRGDDNMDTNEEGGGDRTDWGPPAEEGGDRTDWGPPAGKERLFTNEDATDGQQQQLQFHHHHQKNSTKLKPPQRMSRPPRLR